MGHHGFYVIIAALLFIFPVLALEAQTAEELDRMLETQTVSAAQAARFVLGAAEKLPEYLYGQAAEDAAWQMASENGWVSGGPGDPLRLNGAAFLIMSAFGFRGGVMYSLFPGPRYAYRELVYKKMIQGRSAPDISFNGERLLQIIGRVLSYSGEDQRLDAEMRMPREDILLPETIHR
ncbi:MAG: hypothetical protein LBI67_00665 [Treponema sp.]|jgi:hypothetical protein|nr:hypothetical protein [Treponema sp.]